MYQINFAATDDADWAQAFELIDATTNQALDEAEDATFELQVADRGTAMLTASSADSTIQKPETNVIQWRFTAAQMAALCIGKTYSVGCTMTTIGGTTQLFIGTLAIIDGGF